MKIKIISLAYIALTYFQQTVAMAPPPVPANAHLKLVVNESTMPVTVFKLANRNDAEILKIQPQRAKLNALLPDLASLAAHNVPFNEYYVITVGKNLAFILFYKNDGTIHFVKSTQRLTDPAQPKKNVAQVIHDNILATIQNANNPAVQGDKWSEAPRNHTSPAHLVVVINKNGMLEFRKKE